MAKRQKEWARRAKAALIGLLGGKCARCGTADDLTFDCVRPMGDEHHGKSQDVRISFYRKQHFEFDNIQILCHSCNAAKGDTDIDYRKVPELQVANQNPF